MRKISWIKCNTIYLEKENGGLGVRRLKKFNLALLGKWCLRILNEMGTLWYIVLCARYGIEFYVLGMIRRGRLYFGGSGGFTWCRNLKNIREGVRMIDRGWLLVIIDQRIRDGSSTLLWINP